MLRPLITVLPLALGLQVLAQAQTFPPPLAAALEKLAGGYLVSYAADADLRALDREVHNTGRLAQPSLAPQRMSVNNGNGYIAVRREDTIYTKRDAGSKPARIGPDAPPGIGFYYAVQFRPEQTPAGVAALGGPWEVAARDGAEVTYASPSPKTRTPSRTAEARTLVTVDTVAGRIAAIRVEERDGGKLTSDVVWAYADWQPYAPGLPEFAMAGPFLTGGMRRMTPRDPGAPTVASLHGEPAPPVTGTDATGREVRLSPKRTVLFFSATWCGPCKVALKQLNTRDFRLRDGYQLVYVNKDDTAEGLVDYFEENFGRRPDGIVTDAAATFAAYHAGGIPMMVEIDERGVVTGSGVGNRPAYIATLMAEE